MGNIYDNDNFINEHIPCIFNSTIIEYDMKDAGFSLTKEYKLLDDATISMLDKLGKQERKVKLGKIQIKNRDYAKNLVQAFAIARELFFKGNDIVDNDVISIKKDAIFVTKKCKKQEFGSYINFRPKNEYTSYIHLEKNIEIYYNPVYTTVKGLGVDKDNHEERQEWHKDYMLEFINTFCRKMETEDSKHVLQYIRRFVDKYKKGELEIGYYRTFDNRSVFITDEDGEIDKMYNLSHVLMRLAQIPI